MLRQNHTLDILAGGKLKVYQHKRGYRFAIDTFILAHFVQIKKKEWVLELGTGNGIIALILALRYPTVGKIVAVELQGPLAQLAQKNIELNQCEDKIAVIQADMRDVPHFLWKKTFDVIVSNPPYYALGTGRINPVLESAIARHELKGSVKEVVQVAKIMLKEKGRLYLIYPAYRMMRLLTVLKEDRLEPKKVRFVHPYQNKEANFVLVEAIKGGKEETTVLPPLVIYEAEKRYTPEVAAYYKW